MYCTQCGAKNREGFRFCASCGTPNSGATTDAEATAAAVAPPSSHAIAIRRVVLGGVTRYAHGAADKPLLEDDLSEILDHVRELTPDDVHMLVRPRPEDLEESGSGIIFIDYLNMLRVIGESLQMPTISNPAIEMSTLFTYDSLSDLADQGNWTQYELGCREFYNDTLNTNPLLQLRPTVQLARAALMTGKRPEAQRLLAEARALASAASSVPYGITTLDRESRAILITGCVRMADDIERQL
ncbi:MAG: zinc ribbon domain-containing protein [Dehalococcoidia bacterium]